MTAVSLSLLCSVAAMLLLSGSAKLFRGTTAIAAAVALGTGRASARLVIFGVTSSELLLGTAIVMWPGSLLVTGGVLVLFAGFAAAGIYALVARRTVECGCMGDIHRARLGWIQPLQLAVVAPCLWVIVQYAPQWSAIQGLVTATGLQTVVAAILLLALWKVMEPVRRDRRSLGSARLHVQQEPLSRGSG